MVAKRITAAALALCMAAAITGCGKEDKADESSKSSSSSKAQSSSKSEGGQESGSGGESSELPTEEFKTDCDGSKKVTVEGTKFQVGGKELWFNGTNTPWDKWNDFGGSFNFEFWMEHFEKLHESGVNACRIWISCNGDVGMDISPDGTFKGATRAHWEDLDSLFMLAEQYEIYIMATVQSFDHYKDTNNNYMAWRELIQDDEKTDQYVDNYIIPLVKRYDKCDYLWSIDLCNEPDWVVENSECGKLSWDGLQKFYGKAAAAIHANSDVLVTVGMGMIKYNSDEQNGNIISDEALKGLDYDTAKYDPELAYMDFYSTHWYSWMIPNWGIMYEFPPEDFGFDGTKPVVIGEMPAMDSSMSDYDVVKAYEKAYDNGYNGVFAWKSSGQDDGCGLWEDIRPAIENMMAICPEKIFPLDN